MVPRRNQKAPGAGRALRRAALVLVLIAAVGVLPRNAGALPLAAFAERPNAPPLLLRELGGGMIDLKDLRGKVVVLNFWAVWCTPCRKEMVGLQRAARSLSAKGVSVLLVNQGDSEERARHFLAALSIHVGALLDPDVSTAGPWHVQGLPTTYVVDTAGRIALGALGERDWDDPELVAQIASISPH